MPIVIPSFDELRSRADKAIDQLWPAWSTPPSGPVRNSLANLMAVHAFNELQAANFVDVVNNQDITGAGGGLDRLRGDAP